jgi:hypothetical protein
MEAWFMTRAQKNTVFPEEDAMELSTVRRMSCAWALAALFCLSQVQTTNAGTVTFRFFNESGQELTYAQIVQRMTNNIGASILSEGTFDLATLQALTLNTAYQNGKAMAVGFNLAGKKQGWMVHWDTKATGYSSFLLDNGGQGFSASQTVIFNERLARDAKRQFDISHAARRGIPSSVTKLKTDAEACIGRLNGQTSDSGKGRVGQECVDLYAQAMVALLRADGINRARAIGPNAVWGVTIGSSTGYVQKVNDLQALIQQPSHRWARLIMAGTSDSYYKSVGTVLTYATQRQVKTMGQLYDSAIQKGLSLSTFKNRVNAALNRTDFRQFTAWEVGNEVNGGWLGSGMNAKIAYAADAIRKHPYHTDKMVCLTFYWYGMEDVKRTSLFNWIDTNIMKSSYKDQIIDNIDCVTLSIYTDQQPLGFSWDMVMTRLTRVFTLPGRPRQPKKIMVGEMGYVDPTENLYFGEGRLKATPPLTMAQLADAYIDTRYPAAFATPVGSAYGGVFWWYYDEEMAGRKPLWHSLRRVYCETHGCR